MKMNPKLKESCLKEKQIHFLFWRWKEIEINHDWAYINHSERECLTCQLHEVIIDSYLGSPIWAKKLIK